MLYERKTITIFEHEEMLQIKTFKSTGFATEWFLPLEFKTSDLEGNLG